MTVKSIGIIIFTIGFVSSQEGGISPQRIRDHVRYLSSDRLEGRGLGQKGGDLASDYIAQQFAAAGVKPAGEMGSFLQPVPLVGVTTQPGSALTARADGKSVEFQWSSEWVAVDQAQEPEASFQAPLIFAGHGITAPEYKWDDFKGIDVKGKVLAIFTNEPPSDDPKFFDGINLTYYGRWIYKYEEAVRHGARGVLILHTNETAGYGWSVVENSWGRETSLIKREDGQGALQLAGWLTRDASQKLLDLAGKKVDDLLAMSDRRDFAPFDLGITIDARMLSKVRPIQTNNVIGRIAGSDPKLADEAVIFSAHWDHLGIAKAVNGDSIYNGALDNASGCGILLEIAHAWGAMREKPRRSAIFLATTAEEAGLLGAEYYAAHPVVPLAKTAIDLNYDKVYPFGRAKQIVIFGAERTTAYSVAEAVARRLNLAITPILHPEKGQYFRNDHFALARAGVPAFSISVGREFAGRTDGEKLADDFENNHYHQPSDEFQESWDATAWAQAAEYGLLVGEAVANQEKLPEWKAGDIYQRGK